MLHICQYCKKEYNNQRKNSRFCGNSCSKLFMWTKKITGENLPCNECGTIFYKRKSIIRKLNFCCLHCLGKYTARNNPDTSFKKNPNKKPPAIYRYTQVNGKRMRKHRHLMELHLGRKLLSDEEVHHINGDTLDNRIENLQVLTRREHGLITAKEHPHTYNYIKKKVT